MLSDHLIPALRERFPDRGLELGCPPEPVATFPGVHPGVRGVSVFDDGHELTVCVDDLTHGHFADYDEGLPGDERERRTAEAVVEFLEDLFADWVVVWAVPGAAGGWFYPEHAGPGRRPPGPAYVWSGPWRPAPG